MHLTDIKTERLHELILQGFNGAEWIDVRPLNPVEYQTPLPVEQLSEVTRQGFAQARTVRRCTHPFK